MTALCVDFGGTEIKLGVLDGGEILAATSLPNMGREADLEAVRAAALELAARDACSDRAERPGEMPTALVVTGRSAARAHAGLEAGRIG